MKYLFVLSLLFFTCRISYSSEYDTAGISKELLENANVVKRKEISVFRVINKSEAVFTCQYALTIMNESGDDMALFRLPYDKFYTIKNLEGTLYDAAGNKIKSAKKGDFVDRSNVSSISVMDDNRIKLHDFYYKSYPYTVVYSYTMIFKDNLLSFPFWYPLDNTNMSVQQSSFEVLVPVAYKFHYKAFNYSGGPDTATTDDKQSFTWEVKNIAAIPKESFLPDETSYKPIVYFTPSDFEVQGYMGSLDSWNDFGRFINKMNSGRQDLPQNIKDTVHSIADTLKSRTEKVAALYRYMQQHTHYISIQLGIGGWQPFDAGYVAAKSYGDCKALSNYMRSLLKEAGIPACYTLVEAGQDEDDIIPDFPSARFNHIIVAVPDNKDTIWLECTSQTLPAGYLSGFTSGRHVLMVTDSGATVVKTPDYNVEDNMRIRNISASVYKDSVRMHAYSKYSGMQQDYLHQVINYYSKDKIKTDYLTEVIGLSDFNINSFDYTPDYSGKIPVIGENMDITIPGYANITGKRLFIVPDMLSKSDMKPKKDDTRNIAIAVRSAYQNVDSVVIDVPGGYRAEHIPEAEVLETDFGKYTSSAKYENGKIFYYRYFRRNKGVFPAGKYAEMKDFYDKIYKYDREKIVLIKDVD